MSNFDIGLSGLDASRKGLDIIGNNIANAATEGYHRQRIEFTPSYANQSSGVLIGGGVDVSGVTSVINSFLEQEILREQSTLSQVSQESSTLKSIETSFGELGGGSGLSVAIDKFFNSLSDLSAHPDQVVYQNQVLSSGEAMSGQFRTLSDFLKNLELQIKQQVDNVVGQINSFTTQIASLNESIQHSEMNGGQANNLKDQRDELIKKISELSGVETQQREYGVVDVSVGGVPVVMGTTTIQLAAGLQTETQLGIAPVGTYSYQTMQGGQLGGLLALYNGTVNDVHDKLNTLASSIIQQVNQYHVQGVGSDGSFTDMSGKVMLGENISDFVPPVSDGSFFVRLTYTNPITHEVTVTRHEIAVNTTDTLSDVASAISSQIPQLNAYVSGNRLTIQAESDCKFDFLPAVLSEPTNSSFTAGSPPAVSVSGVYTGTGNQTFTFTAVGAGSVGNGSLKLEVRDNNNDLIDTIDIGSGYAAGDKISLENGIKIAVSAGQLNGGDSFEVDAFANTDTSGLLSSIGMNTFFKGSSASDISLSNGMVDSPGRVATAMGSDLTDNTNVLRLASIGTTVLGDLNSMTASEFYRSLVIDVGQQLSIKQSSQTNSEDLMLSLTNQQSDISGVDVNEEAAQMLIFEQMFQAMSKYLATIQNTLSTLMNII
jgi:flagellar hook-associated protein 1